MAACSQCLQDENLPCFITCAAVPVSLAMFWIVFWIVSLVLGSAGSALPASLAMFWIVFWIVLGGAGSAFGDSSFVWQGHGKAR